jgi:tRNA pseudouridine55 synthase
MQKNHSYLYLGKIMDGWIILDKASGAFSKSAAARVARIFGTKKNGHIGTLDPMATGVLPIAIGNATKMIPFIEEFCPREKEYLFSLQFGFETDSLDITGNTIARTDIIPSEDVVKSVLPRFVGKTMQVPPAFSAVHIAGRRAYELARTGTPPDIPPRPIEIYELEFLGLEEKSWQFRVVCAPGTYVRSLARDIARACGTIATVDMIRRTRTGCFDLENAVKLDFLENLVNNGGDVQRYLASVDSGLGGIPVLNLPDKVVELYKNGGFIDWRGADGSYRVYSGKGFVGIGVVSGGVLRPKRTI